MLRAATSFAAMNRSSAASRTLSIARHMSSSVSDRLSMPGTNRIPRDDDLVLANETNLALREYILNRPEKKNALNTEMIDLLWMYLQRWNQSRTTGTILASGAGGSLCAGGDVAEVVKQAIDESTRPHALAFFKKEFDVDYLLSQITKPYVAWMDGITMGGGFGLCAHAPFRIATEKTIFAMPETKIGYFPDVGALHILTQLDGALGVYLALTSEVVKGHEVFEYGLATHFIPSHRLGQLRDRLSVIDSPTHDTINASLEEMAGELSSSDSVSSIRGNVRKALDIAFNGPSVETIMENLSRLSKDPDLAVSNWASRTFKNLDARSPTSLKVTLRAIRETKRDFASPKSSSLRELFQRDMNIATAFCSGASPDFNTGVTSLLVDKIKPEEKRPAWNPSTLEEVTPLIVDRFFSKTSPYLKHAPEITLPDSVPAIAYISPMKYSLPSEQSILKAVQTAAGNGVVEQGITVEDLIHNVSAQVKYKSGIKEKVLEVVSRRFANGKEKVLESKLLKYSSLQV